MTKVVHSPAGHSGSRRRGEALERAIFDATLSELAEVGYGGLTVEGVAARARTGKAAIYRRWATKDDLIVDALNAGMETMFENPPDTGNIRDDLYELMRAMVRFFESEAGGAIHSLMNELSHSRGPGKGRDDLEHNPAYAIKRRVVEPRQQMLRDALRRGIERGEVRPEALNAWTIECGPSMIVSAYLTKGLPISDKEIAQIVDQVLVPLVRA